MKIIITLITGILLSGSVGTGIPSATSSYVEIWCPSVPALDGGPGYASAFVDTMTLLDAGAAAALALASIPANCTVIEGSIKPSLSVVTDAGFACACGWVLLAGSIDGVCPTAGYCFGLRMSVAGTGWHSIGDGGLWGQPCDINFGDNLSNYCPQ